MTDLLDAAAAGDMGACSMIFNNVLTFAGVGPVSLDETWDGSLLVQRMAAQLPDRDASLMVAPVLDLLAIGGNTEAAVKLDKLAVGPDLMRRSAAFAGSLA